MRGAALALVVAGCFSPQPEPGQPCNPRDDWCPDPLSCGPDKICHGPDDVAAATYNIAFVTSNLTASPIEDYDHASELDTVCDSVAAAAGLPANTYIAWVSTSVDSARNRFPTNTRGFVRSDGAPIADSIQDLVDGKILNPIDWTELVQPADYNLDVFTQTNASGQFDATGDCIEDVASVARSGQADATIIDWTEHKTVDCGDPQRLYCFGTEKTEQLPQPQPSPGKLVFLSTTKLPGNSGETMFDALCNSEAHTHGISTDVTFLALLATTQHAGSAVGATSSDGWHRHDQQPAITAGFDMIAPIDVDLDGNYIKDTTWTGVPVQDIRMVSNFAADCMDWDALSGQGNVGSSTRSGPQGYHDAEATCSEPHRVFCIEQ